MPSYSPVPIWLTERLRAGLMIPAHPLALTKARKLDERRQRALTRYYHAAGATGLAIGVHTTQFEIRRPDVALFEPVLELAVRTVQECDARSSRRTVRIAGICGRTQQALREARFARRSGFDAGLLSLAAFREDAESVILRHCQMIAAEIPVFGFYLQPAVGGRVLSCAFWREFASIPSVVAIKVAAFNRYQTLDVIRGVAEAGRSGDVALYTGNDDNIAADLVTEYAFPVGRETIQQRMVGGLLGHWACWTRIAKLIFARCRAASPESTSELLTLGGQVTDCNGAFFDVAHGFRGCIAGIHEVLRRQGLLTHLTCLDPEQVLSPGQKREIDRVYANYPHLHDDAFVQEHLDSWLS